jgi:hypothetical protein
VVKDPRQFGGYQRQNPVDPEIYALCEAEAKKWVRGEKPPTLEPYATTLPYYFFDGDGRSNWFRKAWKR